MERFKSFEVSSFPQGKDTKLLTSFKIFQLSNYELVCVCFTLTRKDKKLSAYYDLYHVQEGRDML